MSAGDTRRPADVLRTLRSPRLVVVGDVLLDRYVEGRVDRISPEAPTCERASMMKRLSWRIRL